ncbi:MAG: cytochrome c, partial [Luminiphilus sp.]
MFNWVSTFVLIAAAMGIAARAPASELPAGLEVLGRPATENELTAWDIDVRPDFLGLPPGQGDVWQGEEIWLEKCAACHGDFGDSNEVFAPIVLGNITEEDIESGRVAALQDSAVARTTLMKVATLSTLWDYIYRAMPWNAPKSLTPDEVYALLAYILNL